jgi:soluble lytic murein transglycosylase-like protein
MMKSQISMVLGGVVVLMGMTAASSNAQENIQAFVNSSGKIVFTNLVQSATPTDPIATKGTAASETQVSTYLQTLVDTISQNHGVDPGLVRAVIKTESNFNRWAVSSKGALGLMQLIPSTGRRYGVRDFFDPQQNVDGGVRYLKFLLEKFKGNVDLSLAAYNAGENLVERLGRIPSIPETTDYVRKVRAIYKNKAGAAPLLPTAAAAAEKSEGAKPESAPIFKVVDSRGVVHFSNIEPPN